jgi:thermolysin
MLKFASLTFLLPVLLFSTATAGPDMSAGKIALDKGQDILIYSEHPSGIPEFVSGTLSKSSQNGAEIATVMNYFEENRSVYRMKQPSSELDLKRIDEDQLGMTHLRFQQTYKGVRVFGRDMIAHFSDDGVLKTVNGFYEAGLELEVLPTVSAEMAVDEARDDLIGFFARGTPGEPELVIFPWDGNIYLSWRLFLTTDEKMGRWEYFIDANSREIIFKANRIMSDEEIGTGFSVLNQPRNHIDVYYDGSTYLMIDYTRQTNNNIHEHNGQMPDGNVIQTYSANTTLPGQTAFDANNSWSDPFTQGPLVDGHVYSAQMYDWVLREFNYNSFDNNGSSMNTSVGYTAEGNNNAYWNGVQIVVWSNSGNWRSLAGCPDVIAHEWGHAITEYNSNLWYQKESGALNESFSDMIGTAFEIAHDTLDIPDYFIGENGHPALEHGFRNMSDPVELNDPDYYEGPFWIETDDCIPTDFNDLCGVHTNSGVGNKWFYLLAEGGTHYEQTVSGIGIEDAMQIAFRANAFYWTPLTDYEHAALGTIAAATDIDPTLALTLEVINAWKAVGVPVPDPSLAFEFPDGFPHVVEPDVANVVNVTVSSYLGVNPVPGTGRLYYSIDGDPYVEVIMDVTGENQYQVSLPAVGCERTLEFYLSAEADIVGTVTDPPDIGNAYTPVIAGHTVYKMDYNFEIGGWTSGGTATEGLWARGVPVGNGSYGDPTTDYDGSGQCYLTGNIAGESDVDDGLAWLESPTFNLHTGDAEVFFAAWLSTVEGPWAGDDILGVFISNDDGAEWILAQTIGPVKNASGGWNMYSFMVSDFVAPTDQMKLRFEIEDRNFESTVEAAIDAVSVRKYFCPAYVCGDVEIDDIFDVLDIVYLIDWKFKDTAPPDPYEAADVNLDGIADLLDIVAMIDNKFKDGPDLVCP